MESGTARERRRRRGFAFSGRSDMEQYYDIPAGEVTARQLGKPSRLTSLPYYRGSVSGRKKPSESRRIVLSARRALSRFANRARRASRARRSAAVSTRTVVSPELLLACETVLSTVATIEDCDAGETDPLACRATDPAAVCERNPPLGIRRASTCGGVGISVSAPTATTPETVSRRCSKCTTKEATINAAATSVGPSNR
jgi:hypothetical protein